MRKDSLPTEEDFNQSMRQCGIPVPVQWQEGARFVHRELCGMAELMRAPRPAETEPAFLFDILQICRHGAQPR